MTELATAGHRWWARAVDGHLAAIPAAVAVDVLVFSTFLGGREPATGVEQVAIISYAALAGALLVLWHRAPLAIFGGLAAHSVLARWLLPISHPTACLLVGLALVARRHPMSWSLSALAVVCGISALVVQEAVATEPDPTMQTGTLLATASGYLLISVAVFAVGRWSGNNSRRLHALNQRRRAELEAHDRQASEALAAERARIARELHDIVAHSVTIMVLHAAGARGVLGRAPERAVQSLTTIEEIGGQAIDELRRLLGVLRDSGAAAPGVDDPAVAGLAQLGPLAEASRGSGITVHVTETGSPASIDPSVDLAAYRVVQEALTNVTKHAGPGTTCVVTIEWSADQLVVSVHDDGVGTVATGLVGLSTGHGLLGLRERVAIAGGALCAGPDGKGYLIEARLPLRWPSSAGWGQVLSHADEG